MKPDAAVKNAILAFRAPPGFTLKPAADGETSVIFEHGVRVEDTETGILSFVCLANAKCRREVKICRLSGTKTSNATSHLRTAHGVISEKTAAEISRKRARGEEEDRVIEAAKAIGKRPRLTLLLETARIIDENLSFKFCEGKFSKLLNAITRRDEYKTTLTTEKIKIATIELYVATRRNVTELLHSSRIPSVGSFTLMTDFWTCKVTHNKYLGVRVYLVDSDFQYQSVLLGIRKFDPMFGVRDTGIHPPFRAFLDHILGDFNLCLNDFFGATTDAGPDVKKMMETHLKLQWEWCFAHMAHAASRAAYGGDDGVSFNPELRALRQRLKDTIRQVKTVEKTGDLFRALCEQATEGKGTQLLDYSAHRFLSLGKSIRRVLQKWEALEKWYAARSSQAVREGKPPVVFPLHKDEQTLIQVLSLIVPIQTVSALSQAEEPNQVEVLMSLYRARLNVLKADASLKDYRSTKDNVLWILPTDFTPLFMETRDQLRKALDDRFFSRYTVPSKRLRCAFIFETQQRLHPTYKLPEKSLNRVIRACVREKNQTATMNDANKVVAEVNTLVHTRLRDLMLRVAGPVDSYAEEEEKEDSQVSLDDLAEEFGVQYQSRTPTNRLHSIVDEELHRWQHGDQRLRKIGTRQETVLEFWKRMSDTHEFVILPKVARILFAVPASSAQIERDFGACGNLIDRKRASLSGSSIDMCTFVNRNGVLLDITQCDEIASSELQDHVPVPVTVPISNDPLPPFDEEIEDHMSEMLSQTSIGSV